jgi:hypothetical protein
LETPEAMEHVRQRRDDGVDGQPQSLRATQRHGLAGRGDVALQGCGSVSEGDVLKHCETVDQLNMAKHGIRYSMI